MGGWGGRAGGAYAWEWVDMEAVATFHTPSGLSMPSQDAISQAMLSCLSFRAGPCRRDLMRLEGTFRTENLS